MQAKQVHEYDIVLVNVPYNSEGGQVMKPLGLSYLGSYLISKNFLVKGFDFSYSNLSSRKLVKKHELFKYSVVGLSFYNVNAASAFQIAREIKLINPKCTVIAGGPHASALYETIFLSHPEIDIVVRDEGEETSEDLLNTLKINGNLSEVKGISYHLNNKIFVNPPRDRINNLDEIPAPTFIFDASEHSENHLFFDHLSGELKSATALVTSRSCPYNCSFCAIILIGRQWRKCSPEKIIDDIKSVELVDKKKYNHVYFLDANFFVSVTRTVEVAKQLKKHNPNITFSFSTRANQLIKGKKLISELVDLGLRAVEVGIESGSDEALIRYAKDTTIEENYEAIRILQENNLQLFLDFIMFDPETSIEDLEKNIDFLENANLDTYVPWSHLFSYMTPYLGTEIRKRYEDLFQIKFNDDYLPDPESQFINTQVQNIFIELNRFKKYLPLLKDTLDKFESSKKPTEFGPKLAQLKLNYLTIKRIPFVVFKELISQAKSGEEISLAKAKPSFFDNYGAKVSLDIFLNHLNKQLSLANEYETT